MLVDAELPMVLPVTRSKLCCVVLVKQNQNRETVVKMMPCGVSRGMWRGVHVCLLVHCFRGVCMLFYSWNVFIVV